MSRPFAGLAARALASGDGLLGSDPSAAAERYARCAELHLAQALLSAAQESATRDPLLALELLRRFEALSPPCALSLRTAAVSYLSLGEAEIARRFVRAAKQRARTARVARPYQPAPRRHAISS